MKYIFYVRITIGPTKTSNFLSIQILSQTSSWKLLNIVESDKKEKCCQFLNKLESDICSLEWRYRETSKKV